MYSYFYVMKAQNKMRYIILLFCLLMIVYSSSGQGDFVFHQSLDGFLILDEGENSWNDSEDLWLIESETGNQHLLMSSPIDIRHYILSKNGQQLAVISRSEETFNDMHILNLMDNSTRQVPLQFEQEYVAIKLLDWSPDETYIIAHLFTRNPDSDGVYVNRFEVILIDTVTGNYEELFVLEENQPIIGQLAMDLPDGVLFQDIRHVEFHPLNADWLLVQLNLINPNRLIEGQNGVARPAIERYVSLYNLRTDQVISLLDILPELPSNTPAHWHPDGTKIVLQGMDSHHILRVMDVDEGLTVDLLTSAPGQEQEIVIGWMGQGDTVLFARYDLIIDGTHYLTGQIDNGELSLTPFFTITRNELRHLGHVILWNIGMEELSPNLLDP